MIDEQIKEQMAGNKYIFQRDNMLQYICKQRNSYFRMINQVCRVKYCRKYYRLYNIIDYKIL